MSKAAMCRVTAVLCALALGPQAAHALDLTGAYATDADLCKKVFERKGNKIVFTKMSDLYGSGFIVEPKQVRGKMASCTIKSSKEDGSTVHVVASCASDIMLASTQFSFRIDSPTHISRLFPGMDGMEVGYAKCPAI